MQRTQQLFERSLNDIKRHYERSQESLKRDMDEVVVKMNDQREKEAREI